MSTTNPQNLPLGDETFFEELARNSGIVMTRDLLESAPASVEKEVGLISRYLEAEDKENVRKACHALKGACYSMQAHRLAYFVRELEMALDDLSNAKELFKSVELVSNQTINWWQNLKMKLHF